MPDSTGDPPGPARLTQDGSPVPSLTLRRVFEGLQRPVDLQTPPDGSGRLFIVEQPGRIRIAQAGTIQDADAAFLDLVGQVATGNEQGLLGLAFHPDFATNQHFYVNYTRAPDGATVLARLTAGQDGSSADRSSLVELLVIDQPFSNHNAGQLQFGPDGMLYLGTGDGGAGCDPLDHAQDPASLLGKMLRLDVNNPPDYVPSDNPFLDDRDTEDLVWARGLRNPWRYSIDAQAGTMFIGDVGQDAREEINAVDLDPSSPPNFGWRTMEGSLRPAPFCGESAFPLVEAQTPLIEYAHPQGCSVIGGYVYRGSAMPNLQGVYFYTDACAAFLRALRAEDGALIADADLTDVVEAPDASLDSPTSFGVDADGELYLLDRDGDVFRIEPGA